MDQNQKNERDGLDRFLRRSRPVAPEQLLKSVSATVRQTPPQRFRLAPSRAFAIAFTLTVFVALASFGGIGYAASAAHDAVKAVTRVAAPNPVVEAVRSPAQQQYGPGKPPACKKNQVRVNGKCVPKCKSTQVRANGKCVPKCTKGHVRYKAKCVPACKKDQIRNKKGKCVKH